MNKVVKVGLVERRRELAIWEKGVQNRGDGGCEGSRVGAVYLQRSRNLKGAESSR